VNAVLYLASVLVSLVAMAVTIRPRRSPAHTPPVTPAPAATVADGGDEVHVILAAVAKLAARLDKAA
jgi:hypothetical protein